MRQIDHALKVCGADHVGIGSDLSTTPIEETPEYLAEHKSFVAGRARRGISAPDEARALYIPELNHPRRIEGVVRGMVIAWPLDHGHRKGHRWQLPPRVESHLDRVSRHARGGYNPSLPVNS